MGKKAYKSGLFVTALVLSAGLCLFFGAASAGLLTNDRRSEGQNALGGKGELKLFFENHIVLCPQFRDDTTIYYERKSETGEYTLYAYHLETGKENPVCSRVSCRHDVPDCVLYIFCDPSLHTGLEYTPLDGFLYYSYRTRKKRGDGTDEEDETVHLCRWNVQTGEREEVCEFLGNQWLTDEDGMKSEVHYGNPVIGRVNADTILVQIYRTLYLFDNRFVRKTSIDLPATASATELAWSDDFLIWNTWENDFDAYCISTGEYWKNLVESAFQGKYERMSANCFVKGNSVYCAAGKKLVTFEIGGDAGRELTGDVAIGIAGMLSMVGDCIYFWRDDRQVFCLNTVTGEEKRMPDMVNLPFGKWDNDLLIASDVERKPWIVFYNTDGEEVTP